MQRDTLRNSWKISEVAELARVTVRTLHHYDDIGLLVPSQRTAAGYRLYSAADLERLYEICCTANWGFRWRRSRA
jgi:DNA-binding transcriptional MerR regulator